MLERCFKKVCPWFSRGIKFLFDFFENELGFWRGFVVVL